MKHLITFLFLMLSASLPLQALSTKPLIILDPGHGGKDEGAHIRNILEKRLTLRTANLVRKELQLLGYRVSMTRGRDVFVSLTHRADVANRKEAALFVSIHYNSSSSPAAKGIEIYYYSKGDLGRAQKSKDLASSILSNVMETTSCHSRGVKRGNFHVIRETTMPAVLVEGGFLTNPEERAELVTRPYLENLAKGIAFGIDAYVK